MAAQDKGPLCDVIIWLFFGLSWIFFSLRMYVKTFLTKGFGVDDLLLIVAIAMFTTYSICAALGVKNGTGRHVADIPLEDIPKALHFWFLCELFYTLTTVFVRLSIAVFLIRICIKRGFKIIIYVAMTMIVAFSIFYFFLVLFQCSPIDYFWNQYKGEQGHCKDPAAVPIASIVHSVVSFTADWVLGLLPIALIWNLQMDRRTKLSLACILAIGLLAGVATMIRIPYIKILTITDDFLYATTDVAIWSTVEAGLGIIAASAYTLRPLFRSLYPASSGGILGYGSGKGAASRGYGKNQPSRTRRPGINSLEDPNSHLEIPLSHDLTRAKSNVVTTQSPFGDSNEDVTQTNRSSTKDLEQAAIHVHRTFDIKKGRDHVDENHTPWQTPGSSGSDVSMVQEGFQFGV